MQRLTIFDALVLVQASHPDKIVIYDHDNIEFYLAKSLDEAKEMVGDRVREVANYPGFLEPDGETPYVMVRTVRAEALLGGKQ